MDIKEEKKDLEIPPPAYNQCYTTPGGYPVAPGYGQGYDPNCQQFTTGAPGQGVVYTNQPVGYGQQGVIFVPAGPLSNPPNDYLGYSIFVTICCCWLIGIFAIIRSIECRSAIASGDRPRAEERSRGAKKLSNIALGIGIVVAIIIIIVIVVQVFVAVHVSR